MEQQPFLKSSDLKNRSMFLAIFPIRIFGGLRICCLSLLFLSVRRCKETHPKEFQRNPQEDNLHVNLWQASIRSPILMSYLARLGVGILANLQKALFSISAKANSTFLEYFWQLKKKWTLVSSCVLQLHRRQVVWHCIPHSLSLILYPSFPHLRIYVIVTKWVIDCINLKK